MGLQLHQGQCCGAHQIPIKAKAAGTGSQTLESTFKDRPDLSGDAQEQLQARWAAELARATQAEAGQLDADDERHAQWIIARKLYFWLKENHLQEKNGSEPTNEEDLAMLGLREKRAEKEVAAAKQVGGAAALRMLLRLYSKDKKYNSRSKSRKKKTA